VPEHPLDRVVVLRGGAWAAGVGSGKERGAAMGHAL
jgi:hypothetical protein